MPACSSSDAPQSTTSSGGSNGTVVANAGPDQSVFIGTFVRLNGVNSTNANGTGLSYTWTLKKPAGSNATLSNSNVVNPSLTVDVAGTYEATLTVTDGKDISAPDTVLIMASGVNPQPVANAGLNRNVFVGQAVILDGSASNDANNDPLKFSWTTKGVSLGSTCTQPLTSTTVTLLDNTTVAPSFTPNVEGCYVIELIVNDGTSDSPPATVTVKATNKLPPTVDVGVAAPFERFIPLNTTNVTLNGSASHTNPPGDPLNFAWTLTPQSSAPAVALNNATSAIANFSPAPNTAGTYVATLRVIEPNHPEPSNNSATQSMTITIGPLARIDVYRQSIAAANLLTTCTPTTPCTTSVSVQSGTLIRFDGGGSLIQPITSYQWTLAPPSGLIVSPNFVGQTTATPSLTPVTLGNYTLTLKVTDGGGNTDSRSVTINVVTGPTVDALSVTVNGSAVSTVPPNTTAVLRATVSGTTSPICEWSLSPPIVTIIPVSCNSGVNGATANIPGISTENNYTATLRVRDSIGTSPPRSVSFAVNTRPTPSFTTTSLLNTPSSACLTVRLNGTASPSGGFLGNGFTFSWLITPAATLVPSATVQQPTFIVRRTEGYSVTLTASEIGAPSDSASNSITNSIDSTEYVNANAGHSLYHSGITGVTNGGCVGCHGAGTGPLSGPITAGHDQNIEQAGSGATNLAGHDFTTIFNKLQASNSHTGRLGTGSASSTQATQLAAFLATVGCLDRGATTASH